MLFLRVASIDNHSCWFLAGAMFLVTMLFLPGCVKEAPMPTLVIAHEAEVASFDPIGATDHISISVLSNIYDTLTDFDKEMKLVPSLATSWDNLDENTWIFLLRKGVPTHNGEVLTPEDVRFSIERARKDRASLLKGLLSAVETVEVLDGGRLRIRTHHPDPFLAYHLSSIFIAPKSQLPDVVNRPVGTGPYQFVGAHKGIVEVQEFRESWHGRPPVPRVRFITVTSPDNLFRILERGEVNVLRWVPESLVERVRSIREVTVIGHESLRAVYLWMNSKPQSKPSNPFADKTVRQAISVALDRRALVDKLAGRGTPLGQLMPNGMIGHFAALEQLSWNADQSKVLLRQAGYPNGFDSTLTCARGAEPLAQAVRDMLAGIGIRMRIESLDWPTMRKRWHSNQLPVFIGSWEFTSGEPSSFLKECLFSRESGETSSWNPGYSNPRFDELITQYYRTFDQGLREAHLKMLMKMAMDDLPVIPLLRRYDLYAVSSNISWQPRLDGSLRAQEMSFLSR